MAETGSSRCAKCGATLVPAAQWCSLCLTPVAVPGSATGSHAGSQANRSRGATEPNVWAAGQLSKHTPPAPLGSQLPPPTLQESQPPTPAMPRSDVPPASAPLSQLPPPTTPPVILGAAPAAGSGDLTGERTGGPSVPQQRAGGDAEQARTPGADPDAMLAELAATESHRRGAFASAMSSPLYRYLAAGAATVLLLGIFLLVSLVLVRLTG